VLKIGVPIILIRNLTPPYLCNGTRSVVLNLMPNVIEARIITGVGKGKTVFIPRIPLIPTESPIPFKRIQFPIKVCFAMTFNKAQGQTISFVGLDLREQCFSHGQLYVGCSRVTLKEGLFVYSKSPLIRNVVYTEVL